MPNAILRRRGGPRRGNYRGARRIIGAAGAAYGAFQGARSAYNRFTAYRNRAVAASNKRMRSGGLSKPMSRKRTKRGGPTAMGRQIAGPGNELQRASARMYKRPISTRRLALGNYQPFQQRFTATSNFDTNRGAIDLANSVYTVGPKSGHISTPIFCMELTKFQNNANDAATNMDAAFLLSWLSTARDADLQADSVFGLEADGTTTDKAWQVIRGQTNPNVKKAYLKHSAIKMNLYGARKRTTMFKIQILQITDEDDDPLRAPTSVSAKQMITAMERPLVFSNLTPATSNYRRNVKVLKTITHTVQPTTSIDLNTTTGKIMNVNFFIAHNKLFTMTNNNSMQAGRADHQNDAGYSTYINDCRNTPDSKARIFMYVSAFAPERVTDVTVSANETPSMDLVVSQKWLIPSTTTNQ